jgi:hypothetical protein
MVVAAGIAVVPMMIVVVLEALAVAIQAAVAQAAIGNLLNQE